MNSRLALAARIAGVPMIVAAILGFIATAALAQGGNLPNVRRAPDGSLELVKPPPEPPAPPRQRARQPAKPAAEKAEPAETEESSEAGAEKVFIGKRAFRSVEAALAAAKPGDVILLAPIIYRRGIVVLPSGVTLRGQPGTNFVGGVAQGKGAFVIVGNDVTLESITCADIFVPDKNGACVRAEGVNLTLRNVEFRDSENGILAINRSGVVRIIDSVFEGLGRNGYAHSIYVNGGKLHISGTRVAGAHVGHEVKSRAAETLIEDSVITSGLAEDSRAVDMPDGGALIMRRNVMHKGPRSQNFDMIGVGLENRRHAETSVLLEDNTLIFDRPGRNTVFNLSSWAPKPELRGNLIIGGDGPSWPGNRVFANRASAGLPAFPDIPAAGAPR